MDRGGKPRVKKITALLKTRAMLVGILALVGVASMVAIAFAAPAITADTASPPGHFTVGTRWPS
jgi:hypothetical protein